MEPKVRAGIAGKPAIWPGIAGVPPRAVKVAERMGMTAEKVKEKMGHEPWAKATEAKPEAKATEKRVGVPTDSKAIVITAEKTDTVQSGVRKEKGEPEAR